MGSRLNHEWFLRPGEEWTELDPFHPETCPPAIAPIIAEFYKDIGAREAAFCNSEHWYPAKNAGEIFRLDGTPYVIPCGRLDDAFFECMMLEEDGMEQRLADAGCEDCYCTAELD